MAGKKKIEIFQEVLTEKHLNKILHKNKDKLICAEIYNGFAGPCTAMDRLCQTIKLDWSDGQMIMLRVQADDIEALKRFRDHSQPFYMFIMVISHAFFDNFTLKDNKVTQVLKGADGIKFSEIAKKELNIYNARKQGVETERTTYDLNETTPGEMEYLKLRKIEKEKEDFLIQVEISKRQALRKKHRAELMVPHLEIYNFVLFWPHCKHAHPELYEKWDEHNIIMVGREELELDKDRAMDILYNGDAPINEASMHALTTGTALVICFRVLDTDKHFVSLARKILYEDLPEYDDSKPAKEQKPRKTAYELYKTLSLSREAILRKRQEAKIKQKEVEAEKRARRLSEMQRLARQEIEEVLKARKYAREQKKLELLKSGKLDELKRFEQEPENEEVDIVIPEELPADEIPAESSEEEDENEYFPPPGLVIPGFYSPPNDIAKVNGLALLFPKCVNEHVCPIPEFLPPHVLVLLPTVKRYKAIKGMLRHKKFVIHLGFFKATGPYDAKHLAYSVKQFDALDISHNSEEYLMAWMVSISYDVPLLELVGLGPVHVSRDEMKGEEECATMFSVDYADDYDEFEDFVAKDEK